MTIKMPGSINLKQLRKNLLTGNRSYYCHRHPSAQAVVSETEEIPIIFSACTDPVGSGLVDSLEAPGGR